MKAIKGYEGLYSITMSGDVYSFYSNKFLKQSINHKGYHSVGLWKNKVSKNHRIHRLVAETYIPNPKNKRTVNHIDGNKHNNKIDNLEWATDKEQVDHKIKNKLHYHGESHKDYDHTIYVFKHFKHGIEKCTRQELCKKYNLDHKNLGKVIRPSAIEKSYKGWFLADSPPCTRFLNKLERLARNSN